MNTFPKIKIDFINLAHKHCEEISIETIYKIIDSMSKRLNLIKAYLG